MSPLLSMRAPVSVNMRLLGACGVTALIATVVAVTAGTGRPTAAVPACLAVGCVCAAIVAHLLHASARTVDDPRLLWISAGVTVAVAGLLATLLALPNVYGGPLSHAEDSLAAIYLIWHAALLAAGLLAVASVRTRPRELVAFGAGSIALLLYASLSDAPLGDLADAGGYHGVTRAVVALIAVGQLTVAAVWWQRAGRAPTWGEMCVIALLLLSGLDTVAYLVTSEPYANAWWASLTLRAGQFAVPAVGIVMGFVAVADRLRDLQDELGRGLERERQRARREDEIAHLDRHRRERERERIARLVDGHGLGIALQPIVDLETGRVTGAEALARFTGTEDEPLPTEATFADAHALGLGVELELAVIELALACEDRLPEGLYLALNVSPELLGDPGLEALVARGDHDRPLVVELTEHQPVEDYAALEAALRRLRGHGVRVAVDDVGSGFASFRHVTRVNPDILKLDRTLVCGIDEDPVRQSLASAIVAFARDVGATVVSEGIESQSELSCLMDLAVACGQGFYLARPELGRVTADVTELVPG
jgi:EAL domain-containing protein (putative c-di-GMP-specific phosphodiesterase class I)